LIKHGATRYLHYNFVCALLNDLFGIQARGGCMCAGPYAQRLLGLDATAVRALERQLLLKQVRYWFHYCLLYQRTRAVRSE
jgi:selenocysteine lyase/cysteine desulfurase